jgi:hypothetical protein
LTLITPLTNVEHEEEREATLYTILFIKDLGMEKCTHAKKTHVKRKQYETTSKGKKFINTDTSP